MGDTLHQWGEMPKVDLSMPNFTPVGAGVGRTAWAAKTDNFTEFRNINVMQGRIPYELFRVCAFVGSSSVG